MRGSHVPWAFAPGLEQANMFSSQSQPRGPGARASRWPTPVLSAQALRISTSLHTCMGVVGGCLAVMEEPRRRSQWNRLPRSSLSQVMKRRKSLHSKAVSSRSWIYPPHCPLCPVGVITITLNLSSTRSHDLLLQLCHLDLGPGFRGSPERFSSMPVLVPETPG